MKKNEFCYMLSISDFRDKYFESFYGIFMNEETLIQAYQELEATDPRISEQKINLCSINIYKVPYNCLFYKTNSLSIDQYDFHDFIDFNYRISLSKVADVMLDKIVKKLGFDFRERYSDNLSFMEQLSDFERQFLVDFNYINSIWKPLSDMRVITNNISGWDYSNEYAEEHKKYVGCETIAIRFDQKGEIECCALDIRKEGKEQPATYQTALGTFVTNNQGEFGGELTLPNGEILQGNFCEIIECGNRVYAIDSCGHMGRGHFSLYSFSNNGKKEYVYGSNTIDIFQSIMTDENKLYDNLVYGAHCIYNEELYIVVNGYKELYDKGRIKEYCGCSRLLVISDGRVKQVIEFEENFSRINELVVRNSKAYISMDKLLAVIDIQNENYKLYTTLSERDEADIVRKMC